MEFIDLAAQQKRILPGIEKRIAGVLAHGKYIMGPEVFELEAQLAAYTGTGHAVSCASGSLAHAAATSFPSGTRIGPGHGSTQSAAGPHGCLWWTPMSRQFSIQFKRHFYISDSVYKAVPRFSFPACFSI
jgi:hypothetical protein